MNRLYRACLAAAFFLGLNAVPPACPLLAQNDPAKVARVDLYGDPLPAGAIARLGSTRFRPNGWCKGLAFSPDGRSLLAAGESGTIQYWDVNSGIAGFDVETGQGKLVSMRASRDLATVATLGFRTEQENGNAFYSIKCWEIATGKEVTTIEWEEPRASRCTALAYFPDGRGVIVGCADGSIRIWSTVTRKETFRGRICESTLHSVIVSPDGKTIAAVARDRGEGLYFWDWSTGIPPRKLEGSIRRPASVAFAPGGTRIAVGENGRGGISLRHVENGFLISVMPIYVDENYISDLAFSADGLMLVSANGPLKSINVWDVQNARRIVEFDTSPSGPTCLALSPDSRFVAAATVNGVVHIWDLNAGIEPHDRGAALRDGSHRVCFSSDSRTVITAGDDGAVRVWDATTGRQRAQFNHMHWVRGLALSADGTRVAASSLGHGHAVTVWDIETSRRIHKLPGHGPLRGHRELAFTADGKSFASWSGDDMSLRVYETESGRVVVVHLEKIQRLFSSSHRRALLSPDAKQLVIAEGKDLLVFDVATGKKLKEFRLFAVADDAVGCLALSSDGRRLLTLGQAEPIDAKRPVDGAVRQLEAKRSFVCLWELATGANVMTIPVAPGGPCPIALSADGKSFASAILGRPNKIGIYESATGKQVFQIADASGQPRALAFSPDGKRLASTIKDGTTLVWDIQP